MSSFLEKIIKTKKLEVKELKHMEKTFEKDLVVCDDQHKFLNSISKDPINIIAEIKKASPSMGVIRKEFDVEKIAKAYDSNGANAISVLTDKEYFQGSIAYLKKVKELVSTPVFRKDFIIDPLQLMEARYYGADAVLLIAAALPLKKLKELIKITRELGMGFLVEVHDEDDLKKTLKTDTEIIGINNRNLKTFQVDLNTSVKLSNKIPDEKKIVVESGLSSLRDLHFFAEIGINTFLIGQYLMEQHDPGAMLKSMKESANPS